MDAARQKHRARHGANRRFALAVYGSRGVAVLGTNGQPPVWLLDDPSWNPGASKAAWQPLTDAGLGKPEPAPESGQGPANVRIVKDLMEAIEKDRQPHGSMYDGRAALEMILAVYESHRQGTAVPLPLKNREHPLTKW